jgi:GTP pyrophosphokinase
VEAYADRLDVDLIREAYQLALLAHAGQTRASGEDYISHCVDVATILAQLRLDTATIIGGLVHDIVEDTAYSFPDLEKQFGEEVAAIVDGVTKIGKVQILSHTERQVENYRKLLLHMARDARVILIKLADRLHNMRTLDHLPPEKQVRIARETREIYAPLAHRLGMAAIKWELEDLCFKFLEPQAYLELAERVKQTRQDRENQITEMKRPLEELLASSGIRAEVTGRPKHLWSIYRKMKHRKQGFDEIYDLMAMRVITDTVQDCYAALGVIHSRWIPIQERFHDYVATPKTNMYRSIHTTVMAPGGRRYEIQIRTDEMHNTAENGIAAHWRYKEGSGGSKDEVDEALSWFRQVLEWQQDTRDPEDFMEFLRMDLFQGEIFVFTPQGEVKPLPAGATPIDFAYAVHTEVGFHCAGAKVNGRIAPLSRGLKNGDTVEIITDPRQKPTRDWLAFVKTSRARQRIRQFIRKEEFDASVKLGRDFLDREVRRLRKPKMDKDALQKAADALDLPSVEHLYAALGRGDTGPSHVIKQLFPEEEDSSEPAAPGALERLRERLVRSNRGVRIQGMDNMMVRYAQCCQPVPGDQVIGYITRGRGVSIHRGDCPNILSLQDDPDRRVEIEWAAEEGDRFYVRLFLQGDDRKGLLSDIAKAIADTGTNIQHADIRGNPEGMTGQFVVEVQDLGHLNKVLRKIRRVKGVMSVERRESFDEADLIQR